MPESILTQIERRLIALRLPAAPRTRALQELSEHREDLINAAVADECSQTEAAIHADRSLGDPTELADQILLAARRSTWWGRHPVISFCVLPFFGSVLAIFLAYAVVNGLFYVLVPRPALDGSSLKQIYSAYSVWCERSMQIPFYMHVAQLVVIGIAALTFCKCAVGSVSKRRWMWGMRHLFRSKLGLDCHIFGARLFVWISPLATKSCPARKRNHSHRRRRVHRTSPTTTSTTQNLTRC